MAPALTPGSLTLASLQKRLDGQSALIEFWTGPDAIAAVWLTHDSSGITQKNFSAGGDGKLRAHGSRPAGEPGR